MPKGTDNMACSSYCGTKHSTLEGVSEAGMAVLNFRERDVSSLIRSVVKWNREARQKWVETGF